MMGDVRMDYGESNIPSYKPVEPIRPINNHGDDARDWTMLTMWLINHEDSMNKSQYNQTMISIDVYVNIISNTSMDATICVLICI